MKKNHALAALAVVVLAGAVWLATSFLGGDSATGLELAAGPTAPAVEAAGPEILAPEGPAEGEPRPAAEATRTAVEPTAEALAAAWESQLGGLVGRVVEEDGAPVPDISVALVQVDANLMLAADWAALGEEPPELVLGRTFTDAEGRFRFQGAYDQSFQGLGIDLRGPRSTLRVVDTQLHHGEVTDVGDIVLDGGCTVFGRVVDEAGQPVPEARVRLTRVPEGLGQQFTMFQQVGVQDFRADCAVGVSRFVADGTDPVIDLPPIVRNHIDDLPLPTAWTDAEGAYRIEGAPIGELLVAVDKRGLVGHTRLVTTTAGEVELEDATLTAGQTIRGVVVDYSGDPLEGIEVLAGSVILGEAAILQPAGFTGPDGSFSVPGCPETGAVMACARRNPDEHWVGVIEDAGAELELELEAAITVTVRVVDAAGEPVRGARVELSPGAEQESPMGVIGRFMGLGTAPRDTRLVETEDGTYVCDEVTPGNYEVTARPRGLAPARQRAELWEGKAELTLVCPQGQTLALTVVDAATGEGIPGARASVVGAGFPFLAALAVGRTGREGKVHLGPFSLERDPALPQGFPLEGHQVLVQHPRYADASARLDKGAQALEVALVRGGEIRGQIRWGQDPPQSVYMLVLENRDGVEGLMQAFLPPRLGRSDLSGGFRFTGLPAGTYRLSVFDRFLDRDPLQLMLLQQEPTMVHREDGVQLEPAGRTELVIDLSPSGRGQTARLEGSIYLDGRPVAGATVGVQGSGASVRTEADSNGNYETPDFLALGDVYVQVTGDVETETGVQRDQPLHSESLTPVPLSVHRLDLDLHSQQVRVLVKGPSGAPIAGARVQLSAEGRGGRPPGTETDELGRAELRFIGSGSHHVRVEAEGYAVSTAHFNPDEEGFDGELEVQVQGAVSCAGEVDLTAFDGVGPGTMAFLRIAGPGEGGWVRLEADDLGDDGRAAFHVDGLQPGSYQAHLWLGGQQAEPIPFELPEGGAEGLLFAFQPADGH